MLEQVRNEMGTLRENVSNVTESKALDSYPIGSIYLSIDDANPAQIFGGTWVAFGEGRTLVGVKSSDSDFEQLEKEGGEKTHTLTSAELPSHTHSIPSLSGTAASTGGGETHNNLQPYITVYMWKRTA